jgi:hypothetical protein
MFYSFNAMNFKLLSRLSLALAHAPPVFMNSHAHHVLWSEATCITRPAYAFELQFSVTG